MRLLSDKQKLFVKYYLNEANFNASKACRMAGYNKNSCKTIGCKLLAKDYIKAEIDAGLRLKQEALDFDKAKAAQLLYDLLERCRAAQDRTNEARTLAELANIYGLHSSTLNTITTEQPADLTPEQVAELRKQAELATNIRLAKQA